MHAISSRTPHFAAFARSEVEFVEIRDGKLALNVEAAVPEGGVDGDAEVHAELVDGFEDEGAAGEGEEVEVLATRVAAKVTAYTYGFFTNRLLGSP